MHHTKGIEIPNVSILAAAHYLCEKSGWKLSKLKLPKILYFAQMASIGIHGRALFREGFEAWDKGPVCRALYNASETNEDDIVTRIRSSDQNDLEIGEDTAKWFRDLLDPALEALGHLPDAELSDRSHWVRGAWARKYKKGRNVPLLVRDLRAEFKLREKLSKAGA